MGKQNILNLYIDILKKGFRYKWIEDTLMLENERGDRYMSSYNLSTYKHELKYFIKPKKI